MVWALYGDQPENELLSAMSATEANWNSLISEGNLKSKRKIVDVSKALVLLGALWGIFLLIVSRDAAFIGYFFLFVAFCSFIAFSIVNNMYREACEDYIKLVFAKENNWCYIGNESEPQQRILEQTIPELFARGNTSNKYLDDQFLGAFIIEDKPVPFHFGDFYYEVESGSGKNRHTTPHYNNFFAFKPSNKLNARFLIGPESLLLKFGNLFSKKDVNLESIEFNKKFAFSYNNEANKNQISKIFTPALQLAFLELGNKRYNFHALISDSYIVFMFDGYLLQKLKTDILNDAKINEEDNNQLKTRIDELMPIMKEMMAYID